MLHRLRETGPAGLVPLAWLVVAAAHVGALSTHALFVAHLVMSALLAAFAVSGWAEMSHGVLRTWRGLIALGFVATALGAAGFAAEATPLLAAALYFWMAAPAAGLLRTGLAVDGPALPYLGGGLVCTVGVGVYAAAPTVVPSPVVGLGLVGVGQTVGIVDAAVRY